MRTYKEILKEVIDQAIKDNCQSWNVIAEISMEQAVKEAKEEIIEELHNLSNGYHADNMDIINFFVYNIRKQDLDAYIEKLENEM